MCFLPCRQDFFQTRSNSCFCVGLGVNLCEHLVTLMCVLESNVSFSLITDVAYVHYNFRVKEKIMSYPFHVSFAGETFNFVETNVNCRALSISI